MKKFLLLTLIVSLSSFSFAADDSGKESKAADRAQAAGIAAQNDARAGLEQIHHQQSDEKREALILSCSEHLVDVNAIFKTEGK